MLLVSTSVSLLLEAQDHHREFGGNHYLLKPFDLDDLPTTIEELIGTA